MNLYEEFLKESNAIEGESWPDPDAELAFGHAKDNLHKGLNVSLILDTHLLLIRNKDPYHKIAGRFRDEAVHIGGKLKTDGKVVIESKVSAWCRKWEKLMKVIIQDAKSSTVIECLLAESHREFEGIHPFLDGNGRTGRILWQVMRLHCGLQNVMVIHSGPEQVLYYQMFRD